MARGIDKEAIKKILDLIREKPLSWTELKDATNLPDSSLTRYLSYLESWKLIKKNSAGDWDLYERVRVYETEHDYKIALEHSKKLIKNLQGFFGISMIDPELFPKHVVHSAKVRAELYLSDMLREHLRTGYPVLAARVADFESIVELRNGLADELSAQTSKIERIRIVEYVANFKRGKTYPIPRKYRGEVEKIVARIKPERLSFIEKTHWNYNESLIQISGEFRRLTFKVEHGEPLEGNCVLCPKSKVRG